MPPKQKQNQSQLQADLKDEQILQSVLLADPFGAQESWGPLSRHSSDDDDDDDDDDESEAKVNERLPWVGYSSNFSKCKVGVFLVNLR